MLDDCASTSCTASTDAVRASSTEPLVAQNNSPSRKTWLLAVSGNSPGAATSSVFGLTTTVTVPAVDGYCETPTALTLGTPLTGQQVATGGPPLSADACAPIRRLTHYYAVTLQPGSAAAVRVTPARGTLTVHALGDCTGAVCLGTNGAMNQPIPLLNSGTAPVTYLIAVAGEAGTDTFDIVAMPRMVHMKTTITPACDVMTSAPALLSSATTPAIGDDVSTPALVLPFSFPFYGGSMTQYSAQTNGLMKLFPAGNAVPSSEYVNAAIPTAASPNGFLAPFWDDLEGIGAARISAATFGVAPNRHLTVEWGAMTIVGSADLLTFQAQLYETTGVVEFHYCSLAPSAAGTGGQATVGIEAATGVEGVQHSYLNPNAVSVSAALRFTPY